MSNFKSTSSSSLTASHFLILSLLVLPALWAVTWFRSTQPTAVLPQSRRQGSAITTPGDECLNPAYDSCAFYTQCLESRYNCGPTGYPMLYGQRFCQKFRDDRSKLDELGQKWMLNTMHCLQSALVPEATGKDITTCSALEDKAFEAHAPCYLGSGLCSLSMDDWLAIVDIVHLKTLFQNWDAFKAAVQTAEDCVEFWAFLLEKDLL